MPVSLSSLYAPSAATIASAVAAPSAATIASAVAAPSSATIASAVAAAVPTISAINSSVASNAPSPNAWTVISTNTPNSSTNTYTWSSLSGYKAYKLIFSTAVSSSGGVGIRTNGVSTATYAYVNSNFNAGLSSTSLDSGTGTEGRVGTQVDSFIYGEAIFTDATLAVTKTIKGTSYYRTAGNAWHGEFFMNNRDTAAITSITFFTLVTSFTTGSITLLGAN